MKGLEKMWLKIWHVESFQGESRRNNYFEGWYFKQIAVDGTILVLIPGISYSPKGNCAFIQVIIGPPERSYYIPFPIDAFSWCEKPFEIRIGENQFSLEGIKIALRKEDLKLEGRLTFDKPQKLKKSLLQPNAMGFFGYFTFMECYHGVLSLRHDLGGFINLNDKRISFEGGRGYIEKDWGTSFPEKYLWFQCNDFKPVDAAIMCSVAQIPFLKQSFLGFIVILKLNGKEYRFATYNGARCQEIKRHKNLFKVAFVKGKWRLVIKGQLAPLQAPLKAPKAGRMDHTIKETIDGPVFIRLYKNKLLVYEGTGVHGSLENVGF